MTDLKTNNEIFTDLNNLTIEELTKLFNTDFNNYNNFSNEIFKLEEEKKEIKNKITSFKNNKDLRNEEHKKEFKFLKDSQEHLYKEIEKIEKIKELYTYNLNTIITNIIIKNCIPKIEKFQGQNIGEARRTKIKEILTNSIIEILPILKDFKNMYNFPNFYLSNSVFTNYLKLNFLNNEETFYNVYIDGNNKLFINEDNLKNEDLKDCNYINNIDEFISQAEEIKNEYNQKIKSLKNLKNYDIYNNFFNYNFKELY